ncbi:MAG: T9SS C-terminal target domain-containing protein [Gemmatimonadetes bacterium]|nr:MAG: T9SS C-terminal target domain-containing protein [Gemmatimonadota bacterium]
MPANWQLAINRVENQWRVGAFGVTPLTTPDLLRLGNLANLAIRSGQINEQPVKWIQETVAVPQQITLYAAYPNPFNPKTTIRFDLPHEANVNLSIYTIDGRLVTTLIQESTPAGYHTVEWNGNDAQGMAVPSGVYVSQLQTEQTIQMKSMVLLR